MSTTEFTADELSALKSKSTAPRLGIFLVMALCLFCIEMGIPSEHWGWMIFWSIINGYMLFCCTSCFHECAHQTLCDSGRVSIFMGRALGAVMWVPYNIYRESHIRHHAYLNTPADWELWPYSDPTRSKRFRQIFVWFDLLFGTWVGAYIYGRIFFHRDSPLRSKELRRTIKWEFGLSVAYWGMLISRAAYLGRWDIFLAGYLFPLTMAGIMQTSRKLTEHLGMASYDPLIGTRTVMGGNLFTQLTSYFHFDIIVHGPHHRHPKIAHDQLEGRMLEYMEEHPELKFPIFRNYRSALRDMLPHLFRNPGVGMNVGAPPPNFKLGQVENFTADIVEELQIPTAAV